MASFILPILSGLSGLLGGAPKTTTQTQSGSQSGQQYGQSGSTSSGSTTPDLSSLQKLLESITGSTAINNLTNPKDTFGPNSAYAAQGQEAINQGASNAQIISKNILASRGLSYSPYAAYASMIPENNRIQQSTQFQEQLPLLAKQMQTQDLQNAEGAFGPYGTNTTGTSYGTSSGTSQGNYSGTGTSTSPNNMIGGLLSGLGAGFAAPSGGAGSPSNLSSILKALGLG